MSVSTLPAAGGLDVNELSNKLSTIPDLIEDGEGSFEGVGGISDTSSTAAICGSEAGVYCGWGEIKIACQLFHMYIFHVLH